MTKKQTLVEILRIRATWHDDDPETQKALLDAADSIEALEKQVIKPKDENKAFERWWAEVGHVVAKVAARRAWEGHANLGKPEAEE